MRIAGTSLTAISAVAAAVAIVLSSSAGSVSHSHKQPPVSKIRHERVTLTEPYAVVLRAASPVVLDMRTGKTLGRVRVPGHGSDVWWASAAADDRTFVLAVDSRTQIYRFYLLRLGRDGRPGTATLIRFAALHDAQIYGMALTADGSKLAIAWQNTPTGPQRSRIEVVSLATRATRTWSSTEGGGLNVSWDGDRLLAFDWQDNAGQGHSGIRLLDTSAPGTNPLASRLLIPYSAVYAGLNDPSKPVVARNRSAIFVLMGGPDGTSTAIVKFSANTGKPLAVITRPESTNGPQYCGILQADPTGRQVLAQCGTLQVAINGTEVTRIKLRLSLRASVLGFANTFAW